jgi:transglutaminase-like putative cysteine protease
MTINLGVTQASDLSRAGTDYPEAITDFYLQLPPGITDRVRHLALNITARTDNAYDKAIAIRQYLYRIHYSEENVVSPPPDVDGVDYFLFTSRTGNCNYFASAMAVMLRSLGIPTRLCTGYLPGRMDAESGSFFLRSKQYHAWPEVYFPGYGWIEFEATPGAARGSVPEEEWGWWLNADNTDSSRGDLKEETAPVDDANQKADALEGNGDNSPGTETLSDISQEKTPLVPFTIIVMVFVILSAVILASAFYGWLWTSRLRYTAKCTGSPRASG